MQLQKYFPDMTAENVYAGFRAGTLTEKFPLYQQIFTTDDHSMWYGSDDTNNEHFKSPESCGNDGAYGLEQREEKRRRTAQAWREISERLCSELENFAKHQGSESGSFLQSLQHLNRERYDYSAFLKRFAVMGEVMKPDPDNFDYSLYVHGLRMYGNVALVEPLEYREVRRIREFVIAIDTSGSVAGELVQKFLNKTFTLLKSTDSFFSHAKIRIIQCDAAVQEAVNVTVQEATENYLPTMTLKGFGGTDFRPVFAYVDRLIAQKEFTDLKGLLYFTDGYGTFPEKKPPYETAFIFLRDNNKFYESPDVPPWAIKLVLESEDIL